MVTRKKNFLQANGSSVDICLKQGMGKLMFVCDSVSLPILFEVDGGGVAEQG
jgi:hypothetical protein